MEKDIIKILTIIYENYELNFYKNTNELALEIAKLISNYKSNVDIYNGFEK